MDNKVNIGTQGSEDKLNNKKELRRKEIESKRSYKVVKWLARIMDDYYLDPIISLFPSVGDIVSTLNSLPAIYVSLFVVRSFPLFLAVLLNVTIDMVVGCIPLLGDFFDFINKSHKKNLRLVQGFVENDKDIIDEVNKKACWAALAIALLLVILYFLYRLIALILSSIG